jgi:opacity protein-like surface antigen
MIKCFKAAMLSAILVAAAAIAADAADPTPPQTQTRAQLAAYPGSAFSPTEMPGSKEGGSIWISSKASAGFGRTEAGEFYAKKGFGPSPN